MRLYGFADINQESTYPGWKDASPNLCTFLTAINKSQPIIQSQFELVWSRWPRTIFFAKGISIPGVSVATQDLNHAGFTIKVPTHVNYETTEVSMTIIADKEGFHYYTMRNMVMQTGHPLVAGDPMATIGSQYFDDSTEDTLEIRLRNKPDEEPHHHWIIHNFHPTSIGDIELSVDGTSFVEFELKGTFTHITYDCGKQLPREPDPPEPTEDEVPPDEEQDWEGDDYEEEEEKDSSESELDSTGEGGDDEDDQLYEDFSDDWNEPKTLKDKVREQYEQMGYQPEDIDEKMNRYGADELAKKPWLINCDFPDDPDEVLDAKKQFVQDQKNSDHIFHIEPDEEEDDNRIAPGTPILNATEINHTFTTPNGGTIVVTGSIQSAITIGKDGRSGEPASPEESELAKEYSGKLAEADKELQDALNELQNIPSNKLLSLLGEDKGWTSDGNETIMDMTKDGNPTDIGDDPTQNDSVFANPMIQARGDPPLNLEQKLVLKNAINKYNEKVKAIANEYQQKKQELAKEQQEQDDENEENQEQETQEMSPEEFENKF